ncbi:hypothetical protein GCM10022200_29760 [Microbacterium awajiense]|uniref:Modulator of FtsH protease n=1 Tax=Microbacterium awajiense TaxID=415214 RepID=A0ABP7AYQ0_9MICO
MDAAQSWTDFNVAMVGATAALAGLVIVAASVNIADIVKAPALVARLAAAIAGLVLALVGSATGLMPALPDAAYGGVMIAAAVAVGLFAVQASRRIFENRDPANRLRVLKAVTGFIAPLAYLVGGVLLTAGVAGGTTWFAAGSIIAIMAALAVSWVVLVEVLR